MKLAGKAQKLREKAHRVERQDVLTGVPQPPVVLLKQEGVRPLSNVLQVAKIVFVE